MAKAFQLTEWICKVQFYAPELLYQDVLNVYIRCLEWQSAMFASLGSSSGGKPLELFFQ